MAWVVDTCVLLDIFVSDSKFGRSSALCLNHHRGDGFVISPVTYIELAPAFQGESSVQDEFLAGHGIHSTGMWSKADTIEAHRLWHDHIRRRKLGTHTKRPVADALIAGFAQRWQGLITRNFTDFRNLAPVLPLVDAATFTP